MKNKFETKMIKDIEEALNIYRIMSHYYKDVRIEKYEIYEEEFYEIKYRFRKEGE